MEVEVRLFAQVRELLGQQCVRLRLPEGARVGQLRAAMIQQYPALAPWERMLLFAVNGRYAEDATPIGPEAEIACFPPVGGG